jgi:SiaC family regulatory phosphoprotein
MEAKIIEATDDTPGVVLDKENNEFKFDGKSLPEDVNAFYNPIMEWLMEYSKNPNPETQIEFRMDYFNSASNKQIHDILMIFEGIHKKGNPVHVKWFFQEDDEDIEEAGESYEEIIELPFEQISFE